MKPIIIIGYGPVGALLSLLLAQNQIPVIAIECSTSYPDEPRAVGLFGPSHHVLQDAGVYDEASKQGMPSAGLVYRKRAVDNGCGGQRMGDIIVRAPLSEEMDGQYAPGAYFMLLPQAKLVKIIAQKMQTPKLAQFATVHLGYKYISSEETDAGVTVKAEDDKGSTHVIEGIYLVGADGSHSEVRRQLGLKLHGTSWPDRLISTDVMRTIDEIPEIPSSMVVDPDIWAAITPLEVVYPGKPGLWRYSMAVSDKSVPDEQLRDPQFVDMYLRKHLDGPYGQEYKIIRHKPYRMHQLLCTAMRKGKTFLAGDAAHINNPCGGLGLNTGILDADALTQTFVRVLKKGGPESLFDRYSYERRRVFQLVVDPVSRANKQRMHDSTPDVVGREDWFFASMESKDPEVKSASFNWMKNWRTDMAKFKD